MRCEKLEPRGEAAGRHALYPDAWNKIPALNIVVLSALVAVATQAIVDLASLWLGQHTRSTQIALALGAHAERQVAGASGAVHGFTRSAQAKTLLSRLVGLHLRHNVISPELLPLSGFLKWISLAKGPQSGKGLKVLTSRAGRSIRGCESQISHRPSVAFPRPLSKKMLLVLVGRLETGIFEEILPFMSCLMAG